MRKRMIAIGALTVLTGCAVGPDYQKPAAPEPAGFNAPHRDGDFDEAEQRFWEGFDDPLLARLIHRTLDANQTLKGAIARYERAAALLEGTERDRWPSVTASATAAETHPAAVERTPAGSGPERVETYRTGVAATWELDFFGRLRRATQAQRAELTAAGADLSALQIALTGQVASSYFRLRGLQAQYRVTEQNVALQATSLEIVDARVQAGRGTAFDRVRARAQLERTRAELPTLQADIRAAMHRIAVLTGRPPAALIGILSERKPLPARLPTIPVDSPGDVLRRRPDIAAAERRLAAATARIGVATADLFPRFTLGGLLGSVAANTGDLFSGPAESRRIALGVDWTFLDRARVRARIDAAGAQSREALADYRQTVLTALEETETRLERYHRARQRVRRLRRAERDARQAVELARTRYERGLIAYFEVLDAEQTLSTTREATVRSRMSATLAMVDVYRALAGAPRAPVDTVAVAE